MKNIYKALANFQSECPVILKDTQGYGYKYSDLPAILEVVNPLLRKHGLGFTQILGDGSIKTIIFHCESGESIEGECAMPMRELKYESIIKKDKEGKETETYSIRGFEGMNRAQAIGSIITYFRRYALSSILGLVTDKDVDGTGISKTETTQTNKDFKI